MAEQPRSASGGPAPAAAVFTAGATAGAGATAPAPGDGAPSAHLDPFCAAALPPRELWPRMAYDALPELAYPA
ncbi:MAG: hypothetical protein JOZ15_09510, partial [Acidobacteria bacterium]|nr:hypothetical protein [Acidobacteriota bacterium]